MSSGCGPLAGTKVLEFAGIGPAPFCVMLLADLGASVIRIDRAGAAWPDVPIVSRGRSSVLLDLRSDEGLADAISLVEAADVLVEGFRPGVMERLGIGPEVALDRNPRLIYGRMTGWGQSGPRAKTAGHDINYIGLTGMLSALGTESGAPRAPLNLLGDYGGGPLFGAWRRQRARGTATIRSWPGHRRSHRGWSSIDASTNSWDGRHRSAW